MMANNHHAYDAQRFAPRHPHHPPPSVHLPSEKECDPPCDMDVQEGQERMQGEKQGRQDPGAKKPA